MKEGDPRGKEEERRRREGYADKGSHGKRHENTEQIKKAQKGCDRRCESCPLTKTCQK